MADERKLSADHITAMAKAIFDRLCSEVDAVGFHPADDADRESAFQRYAAGERISELGANLNSDEPDPEAARLASEVVNEAGHSLVDIDRVSRLRLYNGIARAIIEQQRYLQFRLDEPLLAYQVADPLFEDHASGQQEAVQGTSVSLPPQSNGIGLSNAIERYLYQGERQWTEKTVRDWRAKLDKFVIFVGQDANLQQVTADDIRAYRDTLCRLHKRHRSMQGATWLEKLTENEALQISTKTASNTFDATKRFFRWALEDEGLISTNPADKVRLKVPKQDVGTSKRRPFSPEELERLFSSPVFTGHKSVQRKHLQGSRRPKDAYFWLPILGYLTGARLGELVQIHAVDVILEHEIPHLKITAAGGGPVGSSHAKHLKSEAAEREIPLHPAVLALGFDKFVAKRRKLKKSKRLFHEIAMGPDGQASTTFSKWFNRYLERINVKEPGIVFHSFRHQAEDAFRNAKQPQYVIDRIIGHKGLAVSDGYGQGVSLAVKQKAIQDMQLPLDLVSVVGS